MIPIKTAFCISVLKDLFLKAFTTLRNMLHRLSGEGGLKKADVNLIFTINFHNLLFNRGNIIVDSADPSLRSFHKRQQVHQSYKEIPFSKEKTRRRFRSLSLSLEKETFPTMRMRQRRANLASDRTSAILRAINREKCARSMLKRDYRSRHDAVRERTRVAIS